VSIFEPSEQCSEATVTDSRPLPPPFPPRPRFMILLQFWSVGML